MMLKIKILLISLKNSSQLLYLASGLKEGEGFWFIGVKNSDENILDDKNLLDCYRKELIGNESAKDILFAINLNLDNLFEKNENIKSLTDKPSLSISFNIPLDLLENVFDFWLDKYKEKEAWETCLGLLKTRKRISLSNLIKSGGLKGKSKKWAIEVETLHRYKPNALKTNLINEPMWK